MFRNKINKSKKSKFSFNKVIFIFLMMEIKIKIKIKIKYIQNKKLYKNKLQIILNNKMKRKANIIQVHKKCRI